MRTSPEITEIPASSQDPEAEGTPPATKILDTTDAISSSSSSDLLCPFCPANVPPTPRSLSNFPINKDSLISEAALRHPSYMDVEKGADGNVNDGEAVKRNGTGKNERLPPPDLSWIECTRCRIWYHSVCLLLSLSIVKSIQLEPKAAPISPSLSSTALPSFTSSVNKDRSSIGAVEEEDLNVNDVKLSIPEEIFEEVNKRENGVWWDWTGRVDRWYCPSCIHRSSLVSTRSIPRSTLKRNRQPTPDSISQSRSTKRSRLAPAPKHPNENETDMATSPTTASGRPKRKAAENQPDYHALHNHISTPTNQWLSLIRDPAKALGGGRKISEQPYVKINGNLLSKEWMESVSTDDYPGSSNWYKSCSNETDSELPPPSILWGKNREPLIIPKSKGGFSSTGGKLPKADITISEIASLVGKDRVVDVIDVGTQQSSGWTLEKWAEYVKGNGEEGQGRDAMKGERAGNGKVYNVISLEISGTAMAKQVKPPTVVSEIDWVDNFWPASKKAATASSASDSMQSPKSASTTAYPKVQLYCLMGMKGSWTDWHVDFAASSVYYTVLRGAKAFFFIRPTEGNLAAYAKWSGNHDHQQNVWLGDWCDEVRKVTLEAGDTMIIPTGYIHAVYTPKDSLVFGGNYLHGYNVETQLRLRQIEIDTKVPQRFRFPYLERLCWYVATAHVEQFRKMQSYRANQSNSQGVYHPRVLDGLASLADFLVGQVRTMEKSWNIDDKARKAIHDRIPSDVVKDAAGLARELRWRVKSMAGQDSEDEATQPIPEGKRGKKRKVDETTSISAAPAIVFAPRAKTRRNVMIPWEVQEEAMEPITSIVQRVRPANGDFLPEGRLETAVEEIEVVRQRRRRWRAAEDGEAVVEEVQEVAVTTTTTRWTSDSKVILQAAQKQSRKSEKKSDSLRAESVVTALEESGPLTPASSSATAQAAVDGVKEEMDSSQDTEMEV